LMLAAEILDTFKKLGISAYVEDGKLFCEPGSLLPPDLKPEIREHKAEIMALLSRTACTCPSPNGAAGCGPGYPVCVACGYTWCCKTCGGCRQCAAPGRKVKTEAGDLPFPIGNGGLDPVQAEMAERHNTRLSVVDPAARRLNVLWWLYQHYQESGDSDLAAEVKTAYESLRDANPDVVRLVRIGELSEETLLLRLCNGQRWLTVELENWLNDAPDAANDSDFQKALDGWVAMEVQLREQHRYRGCIHGPDGHCPSGQLDVVRCHACVVEDTVPAPLRRKGSWLFEEDL
jgi:hypothetical protein